MFDCFCLRPPALVGPADVDENVPFETFPNLQPSSVSPSLLAVAVELLNVYRALLLQALVTHAGWHHRLKWRPLWHIPEYLRINFALAVSLLTVYSCLLASVGLVMTQPQLLWPYVALHLGTFTLELCYLSASVLTTLLARFCRGKPDTIVGRNERTNDWCSSPLMVTLLGLHLSVVVTVCLNTDGPQPD
uniref:Uncharacterized protein n=1 Tax=Anopheles dirus TaxID=7168 RepID=A0A182N2Y3_9DIPT